jgi:AcrR family transcriptional regulator
MGTARGRPVGADSDQTRARILDAAMEQFATNGYARATLAGIAASAGLTSGALYYYFDNKPALIRSLFEQHTEETARRFRAAAERGETFRESLALVLRESSRIGADHKHVARFTASMLADGARYPELQAALTTSLKGMDEVFIELVDRAVAQGELPPDVPAQSVADMFLALHHGMASLGARITGRRYHLALERLIELVDGQLLSAGADETVIDVLIR